MTRKVRPNPDWFTDDPAKPSAKRTSAGSPERDADPNGLRDKTRGPRLQKYLADAGVASRRECEAMIEAGDVAVNGHFVTNLPVWVDPARDHVTVRGKPVRPETESVYVMLYKPRGVVCTNDDPEGRPRAIDLVQHPSNARLYPVGRLDLDSTGLLLMTNDGELANRLTHPRYGVHKQYDVTVKGAVDDESLDKLSRGVFLPEYKQGKGSRTLPVDVKLKRRDRNRTHLLIELREGRNRQVRRMLDKLGYPVKRLRRVRMGPLKLTHLKPGQWRELHEKEIAALRKTAFGSRRKT